MNKERTKSARYIELKERIINNVVFSSAKDDFKRVFKKDFKNILDWFRSNYKGKRTRGTYSSRLLCIIGCVFSHFEEYYEENSTEYVIQINSDDIQVYIEDLNLPAEKDVESDNKYVRNINEKLAKYYSTRKGQESKIILEKITRRPNENDFDVIIKIYPDKLKARGTKKDINEYFKPESEPAKSVSEIPIELIKEAIREHNLKQQAISQWSKGYINRNALISREPVSPALFIHARQAENFGKLNADSEVGLAERRLLSNLDPLGIKEIVDNKENKKLIIIGEPGIGKSSALQYIAYEYSNDKKSETPIYVNLGFNHSLIDFLYGLFEDYIPDKLKSTEKLNACLKILEKGNFILLLDAYNEAPNTDQIKTGINELTSSNEFEKNCIIITSRKHNYPEGINQFKTCELEELSDDQRNDFIENKGITIAPDEFVNRLKTKNLDSLSKNPLFLGYFCKFFSRGNPLDELPESRGQIMELIVLDHFYEHEGKFTSKHNRDELLYIIMPHIAYNTLKEGEGNYFNSDDFYRHIRKLEKYKTASNPELDQMLSDIKHYGMITSFKDKSAFWHQLFQDYFTAVEIKKRLENGSMTLIKESKDKESFLYDVLKHERFNQTIYLMIDIIGINKIKKLLNPIANYIYECVYECEYCETRINKKCEGDLNLFQYVSNSYQFIMRCLSRMCIPDHVDQ